MEPNIIEAIIKEYDKGVPLHEINKNLNLKLRTNEIYKIVRSVYNNPINKDSIVGLYEQKVPFFQIAKKLGIPYDDVMRVINAYRKGNSEYNRGKFGDFPGKSKMDREFFKLVQPKSVLDAYAGVNKKYPKEITTSNDLDRNQPTNYHKDAIKLLQDASLEGYKFDLVDLDPYGSCWKGWKDGIDIAQKGIVISYGDLMVWRYHFKEFDYWKGILGERYNKHIESIHDLRFALIARTLELGEQLGKQLNIYSVFGNWYWMRIYYLIKNGT